MNNETYAGPNRSNGAVEEVRLSLLHFGLSPRDRPQDQDHVTALAEVFPQLPPILVHAPTMRVIDGVHRVLAARLCGREMIRAVFFHGSEAEVLIEAVRSNVTHGKPLTVRERTAAVSKVLATHPDWSDRRIAEVCGVSAKRVGQLRSRATDADPQLQTRVGRDGNIRPTDPIALRHRIAEALAADPGASLREIASRAGGSEGTVRDVRRRIERGEDVLSPRLALAYKRRREDAEHNDAKVEDDEAFRSSGARREFAEWFAVHRVHDGDWQHFIEAIPVGRIYQIADEARRCRDAWQRFVSALEERAREGGVSQRNGASGSSRTSSL